MNNSTPSLSIVIPLFNSAKYLDETLRSILAQTWREFEVILIDDESTDNTLQIAEGFAQSDSRIHVYTKPNGGIASARNAGIKKAKGSLIAFCDHDDLWVPHKLESQIPAFHDPKVGLCYSGELKITDTAEFRSRYELSSLPEGQAFFEILLENCIPCCSVIVRGDIINDLGNFDTSPELQGVDDKHLWLQVARHWSIVPIRAYLVKHRVSNDSYSQNQEKMLTAELTCLEKIKALFPPTTAYENSQYDRALNNTLFSYALSFYHLRQYRAARQLFKQAASPRFLHSKHMLMTMLCHLPPIFLNFCRDLKHLKNTQ